MPWSILLDVILVLFLVLFLVKGYRDGLLKTILSFVRYIASFAGAVIFSRLLSAKVAGFFRPGIYNFALKQMEEAALQSSEATFASILEAFPSMLSGLLNLTGVEDQLKQGIEYAYTQGVPQLTTVVVDDLLMPVIAVNLTVLFFMLLFSAFMLLSRRIIHMSRGVNDVMIIGGINRIGGAGVGLLKGALFAIVFSILMGLLLPFTTNGVTIFKDTILINKIFEWFASR